MAGESHSVTFPYPHTFKNGKEGSGELKLLMDDDVVILTHTKPTGGKQQISFPRHVFNTMLRWTNNGDKHPTLTVGYMARFKPKPDHWKKYANQYCILTAATQQGSSFSVHLLGDCPELKLKNDTIGNEVAWVGENELLFINANVRNNMAFHARAKAEEEYICPDCLNWNFEHKVGTEADDELECPACGCLW